MATLDELANRISILENRYSTLNSVVNGHTTEIHNLDTRLDTAESKLNNHEERIKTIVLGQNTRLLIPTGIHIEEFTPVKSVLKAANEETNSINSGLVYGIEVLGQVPGDEVVVSVFNPTSEIIGIEAGSVLVQVLHLFSYHTVPEKE